MIANFFAKNIGQFLAPLGNSQPYSFAKPEGVCTPILGGRFGFFFFCLGGGPREFEAQGRAGGRFSYWKSQEGGDVRVGGQNRDDLAV